MKDHVEVYDVAWLFLALFPSMLYLQVLNLMTVLIWGSVVVE